ncbi:MAG: hypothetical protein NC094_01335 [Bacteroidales bacterium]|nr:hypothetical protein [Lachnoclostridium sp.]MCM1384493.1 hypothetical protein [Lachnoclostridium sp.]MCM1464037.1 hypothetical protein [Bacteroidales bacterium]
MRTKIIKERITSISGLKEFEGWEIRKIYTGTPAVLIQNPDTGEHRKIILKQKKIQNKLIVLSYAHIHNL